MSFKIFVEKIKSPSEKEEPNLNIRIKCFES